MKRKSLRNKFVRNFCRITILVLVIASIATLAMSLQLFTQTTQVSLEQMALIGQAEVQSWFRDKEQLLELISHDMRMFDKSEKGNIEDYLAFYHRQYPYLVDAYIGTPENVMMSGEYWIPPSDYDVRERDWYRNARQNSGSMAYTEPYIDAMSGLMVLTISITTTDKSGADLGVIAIDINLDSLVDYIDNKKVMDTSGHAFLLDSSQNILAHRNKEFVPMIVNGTESFTNLGDMNITRGTPLINSTVTLTNGRDWDGQWKYQATVPVSNNGWTFGFVVPQSDYIGLYVQLIAKWALVVAAMVALALILSRQLTLHLLKPVQTVIRTAGNMAKGDTQNLQPVKTGDELEDLSNEFQKMAESTMAQIDALDKMSNGNFNIQVLPKSEKDQLTMAINHMIQKLKHVVTEVNSSIASVSSEAEQISTISQLLASGTEEQTAAVETLTNLMGDILRGAKENTQYIVSANDVVVQARNSVNQNSQTMDSLVEAVQDIAASINNIDEIISEIEGIASQTNLLALNASVEAARANVHGKGFAVVAEEVRSLANRSALAAHKTTDLIESSNAKATHGVQLASLARELLAHVVKDIDSAISYAGGISRTSELQSKQIDDATLQLEQISQVINQNSSTAMQSAAASEELNAQAQTLKDTMDTFLSGTARTMPAEEHISMY